jgi:hypothetical protein
MAAVNEAWKFVIRENENGLYHVAEEYYDDVGSATGWSIGEILITENKEDLIPLLKKALLDLTA